MLTGDDYTVFCERLALHLLPIKAASTGLAKRIDKIGWVLARGEYDKAAGTAVGFDRVAVLPKPCSALICSSVRAFSPGSKSALRQRQGWGMHGVSLLSAYTKEDHCSCRATAFQHTQKSPQRTCCGSGRLLLSGGSKCKPSPGRKLCDQAGICLLLREEVGEQLVDSHQGSQVQPVPAIHELIFALKRDKGVFAHRTGKV